MAPRFIALMALITLGLSACAEPSEPVSASAPADEPVAELPPAASVTSERSPESLPAMCRNVSPANVVQDWAEDPEVRRGRVSPALAASVTPEERAADPEFDGFRLGTLDYEWVYNEPARPLDEQRPVRLDIEATSSGFTATIQPGRNGELIDDSGPHTEYAFLPDPGPPIVYTFERIDDCWFLVSATGRDIGEQP